MDASMVSRAIVLLSGRGRSPYPHTDPSLLVEEFGPGLAEEVLVAARSLKEDFYASDARVTARDLPEMAALASSEFRAKHPAISEDAVEALAWSYTYDNR